MFELEMARSSWPGIFLWLVSLLIICKTNTTVGFMIPCDNDPGMLPDGLSITYEYVLLSLLKNEADLAYGKAG